MPSLPLPFSVPIKACESVKSLTLHTDTDLCANSHGLHYLIVFSNVENLTIRAKNMATENIGNYREFAQHILLTPIQELITGRPLKDNILKSFE